MENPLIIYFSRADENYGVGYVKKGNTEYLAEFIQEATGAKMFKVEPLVPYAKDYLTCIKQAKKEIDSNARPAVKKMLDSIEEYDTIFIGAPVYWSYLPQPMVTVLEKLDWNDKTVRPFVTHEGSGLAQIPAQLSKLCKGAKVDRGIAIIGRNAKNARDDIEKWL